MPQNPSIIASKGPSGDIQIFDYTRHSSRPTATDENKSQPDLRLTCQSDTGYGLSWNTLQKGYLASSSGDSVVCVWDVQAGESRDDRLDAIVKLNGHLAIIEDVAWSWHNENQLISVSDDRQILLWDIRNTAAPASAVKDAHAAEINCVAFNPVQEHIFVTGSSDNNIHVWDSRKLDTPTHTLSHHKDDVLQVAWSPFHSHVLASSSADRLVAIWDLERIGKEQSEEDAADGPPELLFVHGGHTNRVPDVAWCPNMPWVLASVAEDNILQIWSMTSEVYEDDEDEIKDEDLE